MDGKCIPNGYAIGDKVRVVGDVAFSDVNRGKPITHFSGVVCEPVSDIPRDCMAVAGLFRDRDHRDPIVIAVEQLASAVVKIALPGNVSPYQERSVTRGDGKTGSVKIPKTLEFQAACRMYGDNAMSGLPMIVGPVAVTEVFYQPVPKSWSAMDKADALRGWILPHSRPDRTNVIKAYEDGFTNIVWSDDSRIAKWAGARYFSDRPRMEITIEALGAQRMRRK